MSISNEPIGEKKPRIGLPRVRVPDGFEQDYMMDATGEADRALGMTTEYSGWDVYNNEARKVDRELVKDWTASLNFLLLFAAIFAAVLTAFIIESKKLLELDPTTVIMDVMIFYTNGVANGTHTSYRPPHFEASPSAIAINCLLFASLSASLVAALMSVVALQWVADYDAAITRGGSSPEDRAKRRQFRYAGVVWWKMSEIIAGLPLVLYFAVVLFFIGLILWMSSIHWIVGLIIGGGAGIAVLFYGLSTFLAVVTVSAPFRTPLSRWIYSLSRLPFSAMFVFAKGMNVSKIPEWFERQHLLYTLANKRMDRAVENKGQFGRDALVWLASQLSISQDSYRRLLLLVGELPGLPRDAMPSFESTEVPWGSIFDLLGWKYLTAKQGDSVTTDEKYGMAILHQCYAVPAIKELVAPGVKLGYITDTNEPAYWSQQSGIIRGGPWGLNADAPNCLFLLLRDTPTPSSFSSQEMEFIIRVARWRNSTSKLPRGWNEGFSLAKSFSPSFFGSCVENFNTLEKIRHWYAWDEGDMRTYTSTASKAVQLTMVRGESSMEASSSLIKAYYGDAIDHSDEEREVSESILLLHSRHITWYPEDQKGSRLRELIAMLWLRPSNPISWNWKSLGELYGPVDQWNPATVMDWITQADRVPHILEILRHLAEGQTEYPGIGPLWRSAVANQANDPHFVEALQTFDQLMNPNSSSDDHRALVDLVCQDLELEPAPEFNLYFTKSRVELLAETKDLCLQVLAHCARDVDFDKPIFIPDDYRSTRTASLERVARHVFNRNSTKAVLHLQASFWLMMPDREQLYKQALQTLDLLKHLQSIFDHPIPCARCHNGPGHLAFHLLQSFWGYVPSKLQAKLFNIVPLSDRMMELPLVILSIWHLEEVMPLGDLVEEGDKGCLRLLRKMLSDIRSSQAQILALVWNTSCVLGDRSVYAEDLAAILVGIGIALKLPLEPDSIFILGPLSQRILLLRTRMHDYGARMPEEREVASDETDKTSHLLLGILATQTVVGRNNLRLMCCARSKPDFDPAVGWLAPYHW